MAEVVYALCALTSLACALLLARAYKRSGVGLLFWSAWGFLGLATNNLLLFVDMVVVPQNDLSIARAITGSAGMLLLLFGLVWNAV